jgi:hypothetical protein
MVSALQGRPSNKASTIRTTRASFPAFEISAVSGAGGTDCSNISVKNGTSTNPCIQCTALEKGSGKVVGQKVRSRELGWLMAGSLHRLHLFLFLFPWLLN